MILRPPASGPGFPTNFLTSHLGEGSGTAQVNAVTGPTSTSPPSFGLGLSDNGAYQYQQWSWPGEQLVSSSSAASFQVPDTPVEEYATQMTNLDELWTPRSSQLQEVADLPTVTLLPEGPNPVPCWPLITVSIVDSHVCGSPDKPLPSFGDLCDEELDKLRQESQCAPGPQVSAPDWLTPDRLSSSSGFISASPTTSPVDPGLAGDDNDDIQVIQDAGPQPIFPLDPKLSQEFKKYLQECRKDAGAIRDLAEKPPFALRNRPGSRGSANKSSCYITLDDLHQVVTEIGRITGAWPEKDQHELKTNPAASILQLNLHSKLIAEILTAKRKCITQERELHPLTQRFPGLMNKSGKQNDPDERILHSLHWQGQALSDHIRQERSTTYITQMRYRWNNVANAIPVPITPVPSSSRKRKQPPSSGAYNNPTKIPRVPRKVKPLDLDLQSLSM